MIENAQYIAPTTLRATINGQEMHIPANPGNRHYDAIIEAEAKGDITIEPYVEPTEAELLNIERQQMTLTFSQFLIALEEEELITTAEAEAWLQGIVPSAFEAITSTLPGKGESANPKQNEKFRARAKASRPTIIERLNPLVIAMADIENITNEQLDEIFRNFKDV